MSVPGICLLIVERKQNVVDLHASNGCRSKSKVQLTVERNSLDVWHNNETESQFNSSVDLPKPTQRQQKQRMTDNPITVTLMAIESSI